MHHVHFIFIQVRPSCWNNWIGVCIFVPFDNISLILRRLFTWQIDCRIVAMREISIDLSKWRLNSRWSSNGGHLELATNFNNFPTFVGLPLFCKRLSFKRPHICEMLWKWHKNYIPQFRRKNAIWILTITTTKKNHMCVYIFS